MNRVNLLNEPTQVTLATAPLRKFLVAEQSHNCGNLKVSVGDILFLYEHKSNVSGKMHRYVRNLKNLAAYMIGPEASGRTLRVRVLEPGETFTVEIGNED